MDLRDRIEEASKAASLGKHSASADAQRETSGSIGTETPLGVLCEIREQQACIIKQIQESNRLMLDREEAEAERHEQLCKLLLATMEVSGRQTPAASASSSVAKTSTKSPSDIFYYGATEINQGAKMIACIIMQIDAILAQHPYFNSIKLTDNVHMEFKDWCNYCSYVINADKNSSVGLRLPKRGDTDFREAGKVVASVYTGRFTQCQETHISTLLEKCPEIMNTVEWVRKSLTKCTGVLSSERTCRLRLVSHPFITAEGTMNLPESTALRIPKRAHCQEVHNLKATQLKSYIANILALGMSPTQSLIKVKQAQ